MPLAPTPPTPVCTFGPDTKKQKTQEEEPGQFQALLYVHPLPHAVRRLGIAVAFYPVNKATWSACARAVLTRCSTSPDIDLRHNPQLSLGSAGVTNKGRRIHGGEPWDICSVKQMCDDELQKAVAALPTEIKP